MHFASIARLLAALSFTLGSPSQPPFTNTTTLPTHFGLLVFDRFQALDVFGPMDVFNNLAMLYPTTLYLSILSKTMRPVTAGVQMMAGSMEEKIVPTITFKEYLANIDDGSGGNAVARRAMHFGARDEGYEEPLPADRKPAADAGEIEVLIVPGGGGTRGNMTEEIAFVKAVYPKLKYIISVCTGATIVSRAGVLDGRKATTNKRAWPWAVAQGPNVTWVPTARWVEDGNIFSSSGVSAGVDVAYAFISSLYGEPVANYLALVAEYSRVTDPHNDPFGKVWDVPGAT